MDKTQKAFAFKLVAKESENKKEQDGKWTARDDVAVAGCTDPTHTGDYRYGTGFGRDNGVWC